MRIGRYSSLSGLLVLVLLVSVQTDSASAAERTNRKRGKTVAGELQCAPVVADLRTANYELSKHTFRCFVSQRAAKAAGYSLKGLPPLATPSPTPSSPYKHETFVDIGSRITPSITVKGTTLTVALKYEGTGFIAVRALQADSGEQLGDYLFGQDGPITGTISITLKQSQLGRIYFQVTTSSQDKPWVLNIEYL